MQDYHNDRPTTSLPRKTLAQRLEEKVASAMCAAQQAAYTAVTLKDPPSQAEPPTQAAAPLPYNEPSAPTRDVAMEESMGALAISPVHDTEEVIMHDAT